MSTEALLGRESDSRDFHKEEFGERPNSRRRSWKDFFHQRRSLVAHLALVLCYTTVFYSVQSYSLKQYQHGPNLIYCKSHLLCF